MLLGVWWIGAEVVLCPPPSRFAPAPEAGPPPSRVAPAPEAGPADAALCTADRLDEADGAVAGGEVAVLSLDPFGRPAEDLPIGVTDYATAVRVHGDAVVGERTPGPALAGRSVGDVLAEAQRSAADQGLSGDDRVMSDKAWSTPAELVDNLLAVLAAGASLVQLAHPDPALLERRRLTEKVTRNL